MLQTMFCTHVKQMDLKILIFKLEKIVKTVLETRRVAF